MNTPQQFWTQRAGAPGPGRTRGALQMAAGTVWLLFIAFPLTDNLTAQLPPWRHVLAVIGAALFIATYLGIVACWPDSFWARHGWMRWVLYSVLLALSIALTLGDSYWWGCLFIYCAACATLVAGSPTSFWLILLCVASALVGTHASGDGGEDALAYGAGTLGIGLLMLLVGDLRTRNAELTEARAELARLAVARERERFARDLHDLLGHTLSVIAIKAELARRLLSREPERAASEIAEVEAVARTALSDVREAVSGYRKPTLDGELAGARMALTAAGIDVDVARAEVALDPSAEAVLAWAVREGATNVIRHSQARHCLLRVTATLGAAGVEVLDDGPSSASSNGSEGHGLDGLRERVGGINGCVSAGPRAGGGYRLAVEVPSPPGGAR
ncbi:MAG: sensor histidine kinase [Solirubrobacteraceae bacterium]